MATAADLIRRSLKHLGVLAAGESLSAVDLADGLVEINALLGTWANERLLVHGTRRTTHTLVADLSPHLIGVGGEINVDRPLRIERAGIIRTGQTSETPLRILTDAEYAALPDKGQTSDVPSRLWVEQTAPTAALWLWPVPTTAATLVLYSWSRITAFSAADEVALPDGYENALALALAIQVAPMFGVEPSGALLQNASNALAAIQRTNSPDVLIELDGALRARGNSTVTISGGGDGDDYGVLY